MNLKGKRVVFAKKAVVGIESYEMSEPSPSQVIIKNVSTLISPGTEGAWLMALPNTPACPTPSPGVTWEYLKPPNIPGKFPIYPGYCNAGDIVKVGKEVSEFKVGDRVVSTCPHATYVVGSDLILKIPNSISYDMATFFEPIVIALHGVRQGQVKLGDSVLVVGQGIIGQLATRLSKLGGAIPLVGVDLYNKRLEISKKSGADYTLNPQKVDIEKKTMEITKGKGFDVVIEATGNPKVFSQVLGLARRNGRVVILGSPRGQTEINFYPDIHRREVSLVGAYNPYPGSEAYYGWKKRGEDKLILNLLDKRLLKIDNLISLKLNFKKTAEAYDKVLNSKEDLIAIVLDWG